MTGSFVVNFKQVVVPKTTSIDCGHDVMGELSSAFADTFAFRSIVNTRLLCFLVTAERLLPLHVYIQCCQKI